MTATEFSYGSVYNQVTEVRNYDYGGTVAVTRDAHPVSEQLKLHQTGTSSDIFLCRSVEVYASDDVTRVSRTDYQYDGQTLTGQTRRGPA